jgi:hypothetical protein
MDADELGAAPKRLQEPERTASAAGRTENPRKGGRNHPGNGPTVRPWNEAKMKEYCLVQSNHPSQGVRMRPHGERYPTSAQPKNAKCALERAPEKSAY